MPLFVFGAAMCVIGALLLFAGLKRFQAANRVKQAPLNTLNSLVGGTNAMTGRLVAVEDTLETPLLTTNVVFYRAILERWQSGKNGGRWVKWGEETRHVPALLDDSAGVTEIRWEGVKPFLNKDQDARSRGTVFSDPDERVNAFAERLGKNTKGLFGSKKLRLREYSLQSGESVHVYGWVDFQQAAWPVVMTKGETKLRLTDKGAKGLYQQDWLMGLVMTLGGTLLDAVGIALIVLNLTGAIQ